MLRCELRERKQKVVKPISVSITNNLQEVKNNQKKNDLLSSKNIKGKSDDANLKEGVSHLISRTEIKCISYVCSGSNFTHNDRVKHIDLNQSHNN